MRLVVHMQPLAAGRSGSPHRRCDDGSPQTLSLVGWMHDRVEEETMYAAVPNDVDERH